MKPFVWLALLALVPSMALSAPTPTTPRTRNWTIVGPDMNWSLGGNDPVINLDVNNAPVRDALKEIMQDAKQEYVVDADVPEDARVTVRVRNVRLTTALDLITQAAGVQWAPEVQGGKRIIRVGKTVRRQPFWISGKGDLQNLFTPDPALGNMRTYLPYSFQFSTQNSTFTCPHCKGQATVVGSRQQPKCPKCERVFQSDWQFCPADGTKRPPAPNEWHYCPMCGKAVEMEKARTAVPDDLRPLIR